MRIFITFYSIESNEEYGQDCGKIGENETLIYNKKVINLNAIVSPVFRSNPDYHIFYVPEIMREDMFDKIKAFLGKEIHFTKPKPSDVPNREESYTDDAERRDNLNITETLQMKEIKMSLTTLINAVQTWNNGIDAIRVFNLTRGCLVRIAGLKNNGALGNVDGIEGIISHDVSFAKHLQAKKADIANLLEAGKSNLVIFPFERSNAVFYYLAADDSLANEHLVVFVGNKEKKEILDQKTPEENLLDNFLLPTMLDHVNFAINGYVGQEANAHIRANTKLTDDDKLALSKGIKKLLIEQQG